MIPAHHLPSKSLSTPEVLCRILPFLTLMWLWLVSTMCSGSAIAGMKGSLVLACVWPRTPILQSAVGRWELAWLECTAHGVTSATLSPRSGCPTCFLVWALPLSMHLFQVAKAHLFCRSRSLMLKHKQPRVSIPFFCSYSPTWLL